MMNVLAGHRGRGGLSVNGRGFRASVTELGTLLLETTTDGSIIAMVNVSLLDGRDMMLVLLGEHLAILDGLDRCVIMILMHLAVCHDDTRQPSSVAHGPPRRGRMKSPMAVWTSS